MVLYLGIMKNILIIIPAYNEEKSIKDVVGAIKKSIPTADILVVNDCSKDKTSATVRELEGLNLIDLPINLGIGGAMQTGYKYAKAGGYDYAMQIDGDGQHDPAEAKKLIDAILGQEVDMVIGSRFLEKTGYKQSFFRMLGINIFELMTRALIRQKITDSTSGFRIVNKRVIQKYSDYYPTDYPEVEVLIYLSNAGFKFKEVSVKMSNREHGSSSITTLKSAYYMVKVVYSMIISKMRKV